MRLQRCLGLHTKNLSQFRWGKWHFLSFWRIFGHSFCKFCKLLHIFTFSFWQILTYFVCSFLSGLGWLNGRVETYNKIENDDFPIMQHMFHFFAHGNCENVIFWQCSHLKYDHAVPQVGQPGQSCQKQKHSPLAWWNSKDHLCNTNGKMPPPRNHEENRAMVCALCIGEHGEKAKRKINAKEEKQVVDDYSKLLLLQPTFDMWGYLSTIPSPLGTHLSASLSVIPFLGII